MTVQDPTTNYAWALPDSGGDAGNWGTLLNTIIGDDVTGIDAVVFAIRETADAALPVDGSGAMTGVLTTLTQTFTLSNMGNLSGTETMDLAVANFFYGTVTGATTFAFSNVPSGVAVFVVLEITNGGSQTVNWPASIDWPGGTAPSLTTSGVDVISLYTRDGGTTWRAVQAHEDSS